MFIKEVIDRLIDGSISHLFMHQFFEFDETLTDNVKIIQSKRKREI